MRAFVPLVVGAVAALDLNAHGVHVFDERKVAPGRYWVREPYVVEDWDYDGQPDLVVYRAGGHKFLARRNRLARLGDESVSVSPPQAWQQAQSMPREYARFVVDVGRGNRATVALRTESP